MPNLLPYRNIDLDETGVLVRGTWANVRGWYLFNNASSVRYVKFYDKATAPVVGTDTPRLTLPLPSGAAANVNLGDYGIEFTTGLGMGATTGVADSSTGAPSANDVVVNILYE